ncbi:MULTISPECIES: glycosyltransferase family 2 protein [unclassified Brevundimonas]|jgi:glycosyltransferase involved in cell wall biosynthesis|uniref:glycosyltransferase family 2 protein n=1 Tax=unclassified Brevundimonas TaxID=2622653 RepID=UPI000C629CF4|nr:MULTISPECIES: glycosyltransferase family 2 protein [unclassified Brevundimonas]MAL87611.1 glycosyl transferase [Brevundimonas sp.]HAJ04064.1 glycosyl transferase [Brevundimonas sp.]|tara:strand:- start:11220 stop:12158 length:939 start_codon:yes stop_codon:yes gene_type:complete
MSRARMTDSPAYAAAQPILSVLIPFLRDDPAALLARLDAEASALGGAVELVVLDDGTGDAGLTAALTRQIREARLPVRLISLTANEGRSRGRNRLASAARGRTWLFLDSDMRPDRPDFLKAWVALVQKDDPAVAFGGFSLLQAPTDAQFAVHRALAQRSECLPVEVRRLTPEKYVYTSNLLVRRDVFESEAFDPGFTGWGWEDVEWAMRVSRAHPVQHVDIPATHMGLDTVESLIRKYEQSAGNFARVIARHPDIIATYPSYRAARYIRRLPGRGMLRGLARTWAQRDGLPVASRAFALRLYRAALYAEAVK